MEHTYIFTGDEKLKELIKACLKEVLDDRNDNAAILDGPMTAKEAEKYLHIPLNTIYKYVSERRIPYHKPGKALLFFKKELDEWLSENKRLSRSEIEEGLFDSKSKETKANKRNK